MRNGGEALEDRVITVLNVRAELQMETRNGLKMRSSEE